MSDDAALVEEIRRHPGDVIPRLIYADYLEETGNPRGELIRVQCQLLDLPAGDPQRPSLFERERELFERHGDEWLQPLRDLGVSSVSEGCFRGGLLEKARLPTEAFLRSADDLCAIEPALQEIGLTGVAQHADSLIAFVFPGQITRIDLAACAIDVDLMRRLAAAGWWSQLTHADLRFNQLRDDGVAALAGAEAPHLRVLNLSSNRIGPAGVRHLANSLLFQQIERLDLSSNEVGATGLQFLQTGNPAHLRSLNVSRCGIDSLLRFREGFDSLEELIIRSNRINDWDPLLQRSAPIATLDARANPTPPPPRLV